VSDIVRRPIGPIEYTIYWYDDDDGDRVEKYSDEDTWVEELFKEVSKRKKQSLHVDYLRNLNIRESKWCADDLDKDAFLRTIYDPCTYNELRSLEISVTDRNGYIVAHGWYDFPSYKELREAIDSYVAGDNLFELVSNWRVEYAPVD
jgi:hypothetical protein